jgi:hypothetical protein
MDQLSPPPGWQKLEDSSGNEYFFNETTGESQWELPTHVVEGSLVEHDEALVPLPPVIIHGARALPAHIVPAHLRKQRKREARAGRLPPPAKLLAKTPPPPKQDIVEAMELAELELTPTELAGAPTTVWERVVEEYEANGEHAAGSRVYFVNTQTNSRSDNLPEVCRLSLGVESVRVGGVLTSAGWNSNTNNCEGHTYRTHKCTRRGGGYAHSMQTAHMQSIKHTSVPARTTSAM